MGKQDSYRRTLQSLPRADWQAYLLSESGLPGPRGNLELAHAVAIEGDKATFDILLTFTPEIAPPNTPEEFLHFCGVLGYGRLVAEGDLSLLPALRGHASDPRWRTREAVAAGLQLWGDVAMPHLLDEMAAWVQGGNAYELRAAMAALCEPRLLKDPHHATRVLALMDAITQCMIEQPDRKSEAFKALRKALGYGWSVAVAALPEAGIPLMQKWLACDDRDVQWVMKENMGKARMKGIISQLPGRKP